MIDTRAFDFDFAKIGGVSVATMSGEEVKLLKCYEVLDQKHGCVTGMVNGKLLIWDGEGNCLIPHHMRIHRKLVMCPDIEDLRVCYVREMPQAAIAIARQEDLRAGGDKYMFLVGRDSIGDSVLMPGGKWVNPAELYNEGWAWSIDRTKWNTFRVHAPAKGDISFEEYDVLAERKKRDDAATEREEGIRKAFDYDEGCGEDEDAISGGGL